MKNSLGIPSTVRGALQPSLDKAKRAGSRRFGFCVALLAAAALGACGGGGDSASDQVNAFTGSSGSGSNSSSSCNSNYSDQVQAKTRSNASKDPQCSSYVANADSYLAAARASCVAGNTSAANQYYENFVKAADYADKTVAALCGSSGSGSGSGSNTGTTTGQLTLYIKYGNSGANNGKVLSGVCTTSRPSDDAGYQWVAVAQNLTSDQCASKAKEYGLS